MAASMMGHTPEINDNYYTSDISELDKKHVVLEQANMLMAN